ncbi:P-loop NTPase fold protein [Uliginosibacterium sp. H3]|uniref:P-loop NTPase fold protein n=1 Tax=Uliginosibacterium silvisoli TaxID=3114758 RepID=A0ABU6K155_9RHOO|nr:P-loop NTPase fold protein [Uliginosibacterium sp. H3]
MSLTMEPQSAMGTIAVFYFSQDEKAGHRLWSDLARRYDPSSVVEWTESSSQLFLPAARTICLALITERWQEEKWEFFRRVLRAKDETIFVIPVLFAGAIAPESLRSLSSVELDWDHWGAGVEAAFAVIQRLFPDVSTGQARIQLDDTVLSARASTSSPPKATPKRAARKPDPKPSARKSETLSGHPEAVVASQLFRATLPTASSDAVAERDELDRNKLTDALEHMLLERNNVRPFCIGLFGHWGSGKSSQIDFLRKRLVEAHSKGRPRVKVAEFNAWQHEKADNLAAALAQVVVEALTTGLSYSEQLALAWKMVKKRHAGEVAAVQRDMRFGRTRWLRIRVWIETSLPVWLPILAMLAAFSMILLPVNSPWSISWWAAIPLTTVGTIFTALISVKKFVAENLTQWFNRLNVKDYVGKLRLPDYTAQLGLLSEIHRTLRQLCGLRLGDDAQSQENYLLLIVDDLDRCTPKTVKEVFDAVRLVADVSRVITLVAIDERMAFAAVEKHYDQFAQTGREPALVARDFLAKVFQVVVTLPAVSHAQIKKFVLTEIFKDSAEIAKPGDHEGAEKAKDILSPTANTHGPTNSGAHPSETLGVSPQSAFIEKKYLAQFAEEPEMFADYANGCGFANPRLLWRMKQAWILLKHLALKEGATLEEVRGWMGILFVCEWLLQQTLDEREQHHLKLIQHDVSGFTAGIPEHIKSAISDDVLDTYADRQLLVCAVLLPAGS